uniref:XRCC4 N-terminal domain-containing protein n=1 Tax=Physcomitrium patens TaxID=3218 RepID=A0A2K1IYC7_PHYPA|nr:hypothetical protein PHYPA_024095 [Physcomitrium patens]
MSWHGSWMDQDVYACEDEKELGELSPRASETYAKLELPEGAHQGCGHLILYVKGTWYPTHFLLSVLDGQDTWDFNEATQEFVCHQANEIEMEAREWLNEVYLCFSQQRPCSYYSFVSTGSSTKMASFSSFCVVVELGFVVLGFMFPFMWSM